MAQVYRFTDENGQVRLFAEIDPSPAGTYAQVSLSNTVAAWDGTAVPFDVVDYDPLGLWNSVAKGFAPKVAGWYRVAAWGTRSSGFISLNASVGTGLNVAYASVNGAGANVFTVVSQHTAVADGVLMFPLIAGVTHLDVGDTIDIEGDGGASWSVIQGASFSIQLVAVS